MPQPKALPQPKRGEIWRVDLNPTRGAEMNKTRPVVVMSSDRIGKLPLRLVVPLTSWQDEFSLLPWMTRVDPDKGNKLSKSSAADAFQMRSVSLERFVEKVGVLDDKDAATVAAAIMLSIGYEVPENR